MGDMTEEFEALRAWKREQREERAAVNITKLKELGVNALEQSKNVFRVNTPVGAVMYYVSSGKWQHRGSVHWGNAQSFANCVKKLQQKTITLVEASKHADVDD